MNGAAAMVTSAVRGAEKLPRHRADGAVELTTAPTTHFYSIN